MSEPMPHWISATSRTKGQVFICSKCEGKCHCIARGNANKYHGNYCDYQYCPRCGEKMDSYHQTVLVSVEKMREEQA